MQDLDPEIGIAIGLRPVPLAGMHGMPVVAERIDRQEPARRSDGLRDRLLQRHGAHGHSTLRTDAGQRATS